MRLVCALAPSRARLLWLAVLALGMAASPTMAAGQANPADVASPDAIVAATYEAIGREAGAEFDWDRFRSLFLPTATLIPNLQQTGGEFRVLSVQDFIDWIDSGTNVGGPNDRGFYEEGVHSVVHQYGVIAQVFSTYEKRFADSEQLLGRGINSFLLVNNDGRWWISGVAWDEETSGIAVPAEYRGNGN